MDFRRFSVLLLLCGLTTLDVHAHGDTSQRMNVLLVVVDDLNDYVGYMNGHPQSVTPNLDQLAERGTVFTNAYCNAVQCSPSRLSFMSGKLPDYTGIYLAGQYDDGDLRGNFGTQPHWMLPEVLKDSGGYFTAASSKIYHGKRQNPPFTDVDFDTAGTDNCARSKSWSVAFAPPSVTATPSPANTHGFLGTKYIWGQIDDSQETDTEDYYAVNAGLQFLQQYKTNPAAVCNRPFFLGVGIYRPHTPFFSPAKYWLPDFNPDYNQYPYNIPYNDPPNAWPPNGIVMAPQPDSALSDYAQLPFLGKVNANGSVAAINSRFDTFGLSLDPLPLLAPGMDTATRMAVLAESARSGAMAGYLASIRYADAMLGRLIKSMDGNAEIRDRTIIIVVSDHGYNMREKRHYGKVSNWDQTTRIPFIIVDPRRPGKQVVHTPVSLIDLFPTVLDLTGVEEPTLPDGSRYLDGESLVPYLDQPDLESRTPAISAISHSGAYVDGKCFPHYGIRYGRWHYLRYLTNAAEDSAAYCSRPESRIQEELYEIGVRREVDPNEWHNLAGNPDYRGIMDFLASMLPPDGLQLYGPVSQVEIVRDSLDCLLNLNNVTEIGLRYTDRNGNVYTGAAPGVVYTWSAPSLNSVQIGSSGFVHKSLLDSATLAGRDAIALTLKAIDTVHGGYAEDLVRLAFSADAVPRMDIDLTYPTANSVLVSAGMNGLAKRVAWDFGDGFTTEDPRPAAHAYSYADTFPVRVEAFYGNNPEQYCSVRADTLAVIADTAFQSLPCQSPTGIRISEVGARRVKATWANVQLADFYEYRYRPQDDPIGNWAYGMKNKNFDLIRPLQPNLGLELEIRAHCSGAATDTSAWSRPVYFRTLPCYAPINVRVDSVGISSATLSFDPQNAGMTGHQVYVRRTAGGPTQSVLLNGSYTATFPGLQDSTEYQFVVRAFCPDKDGNPNSKGPYSAIGSFSTLPDNGERNMDPQLANIVPNPASDWVRVRLKGKGIVRVVDANGQERWSGKVRDEVLDLDVSGWPVGWYSLEWFGPGGQHQREALVVSR